MLSPDAVANKEAFRIWIYGVPAGRSALTHGAFLTCSAASSRKLLSRGRTSIGVICMGSTGPLAIGPALKATTLSYDPEKDFVAVGAVAWAPQVLVVRKDTSVKNFKGFLSYAKRPDTQLRYGARGMARLGI